MGGLADDQARFVAVLEQGPSALPEGLFAGETGRVLLGLKVHANTISHARLVALEQTYPRTLAHIGHEAFNQLTRAFVELPPVRRRRLMDIGAGFPAYLAEHAADSLAPDLAAIEWAWLESYHAADAATLRLADLAHLDEAGLLDLPVIVHPAMRLVPVQADASDLLPELAATAPPKAVAILVTRPDETVMLRALDSSQARLAAMADNSGTMRNLLQAAIETGGEADALPAILALIEAGALARPDG